jgi:DNA-binding FrmR family transcriptional regulator
VYRRSHSGQRGVGGAQGLANGLLDEHVRHCVKEATESGDADGADRMVTAATKAIERLVRA